MPMPDRSAVREALHDELHLLRVLNQTRRMLDLTPSEREEIEAMRAAALLKVRGLLPLLRRRRP